MKQSFEDEENFEDGQYPSRPEQVRNMLIGLSELGKNWKSRRSVNSLHSLPFTKLNLYTVLCHTCLMCVIFSLALRCVARLMYIKLMFRTWKPELPKLHFLWWNKWMNLTDYFITGDSPPMHSSCIIITLQTTYSVKNHETYLFWLMTRNDWQAWYRITFQKLPDCNRNITDNHPEISCEMQLVSLRKEHEPYGILYIQEPRSYRKANIKIWSINHLFSFT